MLPVLQSLSTVLRKLTVAVGNVKISMKLTQMAASWNVNKNYNYTFPKKTTRRVVFFIY